MDPSHCPPDHGFLYASPLFPPHTTPLQRLCLSASGNLQLVLRAYLNRELQFELRIHASRMTHAQATTVTRTIQLHVDGTPVCLAHSVTTVHAVDSPHLQAFIDGHVGIGQLFQRLDQYPRFQLLDYAVADRDGAVVYDASLFGTVDFRVGMCRSYTLTTPSLSSHITELFPAHLFEAGVHPTA
jgi:chorismate-pyruvate lyase